MIKLSEETHTSLYYNVDECIEFCKNIPDTKSSKIEDFHMLWNVGRQFGRKQLLPIKSFLCTQDLKQTRFNLWSNLDLRKNEYFKPFVHLVNCRLYDPIEEAKGTVLEGYNTLLTANDHLNWVMGDVFRALCLHKHGGVYIDADVVMLRSFAPLLEQEFMYKWSWHPTLINSAVMRMNAKSELSSMILEIMTRTQIRPATACLSAELYSTLRETNKDWTVFPCGFFNTEWVYKFTDEEKRDHSNFELLKFIREPMAKTSHSNEMYEGAFSWHWHNNWDTNVEVGSKWWLLEDKFDKLIYEKFGIKPTHSV